ncbi:MAG: hypothetical protein KatS3mg087_2204 [Patescibacteria group bacterium]|nr:MAG: hypothetical protein KatS3mg087_2204 [Patescibacteria group bacterium]
MSKNGGNRILLFSRQPYAITVAKLPKPLSLAGFEVGSLCLERSFLWKSRYLDVRFSCPLNPRSLILKLIRIIRDWQPYLIIPGDPWSLHYLQRLAESRFIRFFPDIHQVLVRSLGNPKCIDLLASKQLLLQFAQELGVRQPEDSKVDNVEVAKVYAKRNGYPVVVKQEYNSGGNGVWVCRDEVELVAAFGEAQFHKRSKGIAGMLRAAWSTYNRFPYAPEMNTGGQISIQRFIEGMPALCSFVALEGSVLASNIVERSLPYDGPTSPHCMYRSITNDEIENAVHAIVKRTGFSGFGCFDFMIDSSGQAYLIECNPFPVNVAHLGNVLGKDLCLALYNKITGRNRGDFVAVEKGRIVFLFPYELMRDPDSVNIVLYPSDIPLDEPELLRLMMRHFNIPADVIERIVNALNFRR